MEKTFWKEIKSNDEFIKFSSDEEYYINKIYDHFNKLTFKIQICDAGEYKPFFDEKIVGSRGVKTATVFTKISGSSVHITRKICYSLLSYNTDRGHCFIQIIER